MLAYRFRSTTWTPVVTVTFAMPTEAVPWVVRYPVTTVPEVFAKDDNEPNRDDLTWAEAAKLLDESYLSLEAQIATFEGEGGLCLKEDDETVDSFISLRPIANNHGDHFRKDDPPTRDSAEG